MKRVFISWISELDRNRSLFLLTTTSNEKIYWDGSDSICNCLYNWRHESWLPAFVIKSLKPKNSYGYDGISTKLLKISSPFIISSLTYICNKSISLGIFPDRLKYAVVKPIFKKGDRSNITNYRPISMLSSFSKVFEKNYAQATPRSPE